MRGCSGGLTGIGVATGPMSIKYLTQVWENSRATGTDLLVLLALADQANDSGWSYPSVAFLARKCRIDPRTTQRRIRSLEDQIKPVQGRSQSRPRQFATHENQSKGGTRARSKGGTRARSKGGTRATRTVTGTVN
jgi:hypothetical protein